MQMHCLHTQLYKLSKLIAPEQKLSDLEKIYKNQVDTWELLHHHKVSDKDKQKMVGISRATRFDKHAQRLNKIKSIQVDGVSEFTKNFEKACEKFGIPLLVLPPARPKYNGGVERSNRICREEFYERLQEDSLCGARLALSNFIKIIDHTLT